MSKDSFASFRSTARPHVFGHAWAVLLAEHAARHEAEQRELMETVTVDIEDEFVTRPHDEDFRPRRGQRSWKAHRAFQYK